MSRLLLSLAILLASGAALGQQTDIVDGDTVKQSGVTYRLWGIDAPESRQVCPDGWPAGRLAATRLQELVAGRAILCEARGRDRYGRTIAKCTAAGADLGALLVREGMARAFVRYSADYLDQEQLARAERRGLHAHDCAAPWDWRAGQRATP